MNGIARDDLTGEPRECPLEVRVLEDRRAPVGAGLDQFEPRGFEHPPPAPVVRAEFHRLLGLHVEVRDDEHGRRAAAEDAGDLAQPLADVGEVLERAVAEEAVERRRPRSAGRCRRPGPRGSAACACARAPGRCGRNPGRRRASHCPRPWPAAPPSRRRSRGRGTRCPRADSDVAAQCQMRFSSGRVASSSKWYSES